MTFDEAHEIVLKSPKRFLVLRLLFNYSKEYMAYCLKIGQTSYGNLERGVTVIKHEHIVSFCKALSITTDEFAEFDLTAIIKKAKLKV